jgi:S-adenosylhomocysteine hydrolase
MSTGDFRVADISLADFGRKEIELAEYEVCTDSRTLRMQLSN